MAKYGYKSEIKSEMYASSCFPVVVVGWLLNPAINCTNPCQNIWSLK